MNGETYFSHKKSSRGVEDPRPKRKGYFLYKLERKFTKAHLWHQKTNSTNNKHDDLFFWSGLHNKHFGRSTFRIKQLDSSTRNKSQGEEELRTRLKHKIKGTKRKHWPKNQKEKNKSNQETKTLVYVLFLSI